MLELLAHRFQVQILLQNLHECCYASKCFSSNNGLKNKQLSSWIHLRTCKGPKQKILVMILFPKLEYLLIYKLNVPERMDDWREFHSRGYLKNTVWVFNLSRFFETLSVLCENRYRGSIYRISSYIIERSVKGTVANFFLV